MVLLLVKNNKENQFLYETSVNCSIDRVIEEVCAIYNGILKINRLCYEIEELAKHGTLFPPEILDVYESEVEKLGLKDAWGDKCIPNGGYSYNKDPVGRRNGKKPNEHMEKTLKQAVEEVRTMVSKKLIEVNKCLNLKKVQEALDILRGVVLIVYPMNLPPHDVIRKELENNEDLTGTQAAKEVIDSSLACLWCFNKQMFRGKVLKDFVGSNEKTKVIVKLSRSVDDQPVTEPGFSEEERKAMMYYSYKRQEELKKLDRDDDDNYHNSPWADSGNLKRSLQGCHNISWKP